MTYPVRFANAYELASLPWFELHDGRLIADPGLGPAIDVHTHLALSFLWGHRVNLMASCTCQHYLPLDAPLDLDIYANRNFSPAHLQVMKRDLSINGTFGIKGMRDTHTAPNLLHDMEALNITASVLLPIDMPFISRNAERYLDIARTTQGLLSFGSVHPFDPHFAARLEQQKRDGAKGIKIHPAIQSLPPDHPRCMEVYRACGDLGLPVLWHCGPVDIETAWGRHCSQLKHYWKAIHDHPSTTFILGHSGALQMDMALKLAQMYPNVYLEVASQGYSNVATLVANAPIERLMFGTDWPFYHQAAGLAKVFMATEHRPTERSLILYQNAARLFNLEG